MHDTSPTTTWRCRVAPSLGSGFAGTPSEVWGTQPFDNDSTDPTVFFGLYGLPDFFALWRYRGPKAVLWAGTDITHFKHGYWLDAEGHIKLNPEPLGKWIAENVDSYVENEVERIELLRLGIESKVIPSFLGNVNDYPLIYTHKEKPRFYTSVSGDDFELYGWEDIENMSDDYPNVEFHLYGNTTPWYTDKPNIFVHGRVTQGEMNADIMGMTGALRLTKHDGFSEILAKSLLWGQWPVSPYIDYPHVSSSIKEAVRHMTKPNVKGRDYYLSVINDYPWNVSNN